MMKNFTLVLFGLFIGLSIVSYSVTVNKIKKAPEPVTSVQEKPAELIDPVEITAPEVKVSEPVAQVNKEMPEVLSTDEPLDVSMEEPPSLSEEPTEIVATGSGSILSDMERKRIEEAKLNAGWANAKFLPKEAQEVIQPEVGNSAESEEQVVK